jgi:hypothetical protein
MKPNGSWAASSPRRSVAAVLVAAVIASAAVTGLLYAVRVTEAGQSLDATSLDRSAGPKVIAIDTTRTSSPSGTVIKFQPVRTASVRGTNASHNVSVLHVNSSGLTPHPLPLGSVQSPVCGDPHPVTASRSNRFNLTATLAGQPSRPHTG